MFFLADETDLGMLSLIGVLVLGDFAIFRPLHGFLGLEENFSYSTLATFVVNL